MMSSAFVLAVDIGTSRTAASIARTTATGEIEATRFTLGRMTETTPSAVFVSHDGLLFGEAAERRGLAEPERLVREFKRRIGDDVAVVVDGIPYPAEELFAHMVAWVVDAATEREGGPPASVVATVPVTWGDYRRSLVAAALARTVSCPVDLVTEPDAAARHYESTSPLGAGRALAVYDLGGGTFDVALVRKSPEGVAEIVGTPSGIPDFGGADFDDLVFHHVVTSAGLPLEDLAADPDAYVPLATLRRECVEAKEALSFDSEAVIPVLVGGHTVTVRLTRSEFEEAIEDGIARTVDVLDEALEAAGIAPTDLEAILLTGGSSRIPRVAQLLSERFDRPIAVDADPKAVVSLGAARAVMTAGSGARTDADEARELVPLPESRAALAVDRPTVPTSDPVAARKRQWLRRTPGVATVAGCSVLLAGSIVLMSASGLGSAVLREDASPVSLLEWLGADLTDPSPEPHMAGDEAATSASDAPPAMSQPTTPPRKPPASSKSSGPSAPTASPKAPTPTSGPQPSTLSSGAPTSQTGGSTTPDSTGGSNTPPPDETTQPPDETTPPPDETTPPPDETTPPPDGSTQPPDGSTQPPDGSTEPPPASDPAGTAPDPTPTPAP